MGRKRLRTGPQSIRNFEAHCQVGVNFCVWHELKNELPVDISAYAKGSRIDTVRTCNVRLDELHADVGEGVERSRRMRLERCVAEIGDALGMISPQTA